jgi:hypothetical protein
MRVAIVAIGAVVVFASGCASSRPAESAKAALASAGEVGGFVSVESTHSAQPYYPSTSVTVQAPPPILNLLLAKLPCVAVINRDHGQAADGTIDQAQCSLAGGVDVRIAVSSDNRTRDLDIALLFDVFAHPVVVVGEDWSAGCQTRCTLADLAPLGGAVARN